MEKRVAVYNNNTGVIETMSSLLAGEGLKMVAVTGRAQLQELLRAQEIQLLLLDVELDGRGWGEGIEMIHDIRNMTTIPIIIISAQDAEPAKIMALNAGADDYVTKPFGMMELISRIKAVLRRSGKQQDKTKLSVGGISLDTKKHEVKVDGEQVVLTLKEFELLEKLMRNQGIVLTRDQLLTEIWGYDFDGETRTVDVHIRTLRQKLGEQGSLVKTVRGVGYRIGGEA